MFPLLGAQLYKGDPLVSVGPEPEGRQLRRGEIKEAWCCRRYKQTSVLWSFSTGNIYPLNTSPLLIAVGAKVGNESCWRKAGFPFMGAVGRHGGTWSRSISACIWPWGRGQCGGTCGQKPGCPAGRQERWMSLLQDLGEKMLW